MMTEEEAHKKWPFRFMRTGEIEILKICGIPVYRRIGVAHWCLGFIWVDV